MRARVVVWICVLISALSLASGCAASKPLATKQPAASDRIVVMISVDGLANFYLDDPKAEMPTIRELARLGARAGDGMKAVVPTVTWPNHTTLVTGDFPARHGVVGNNYFDRATGKSVILISDPVYDKDQIVKVPTIYDLAKSHGMSTAAIRWPASRNAKTLDWTIPDVAADDLLHKYATPGLIEECRKAGVWADGAAQEGEVDRRIVTDRNSTAIFNFILHTHRPELALLHITDVDHTQHLRGPRTPEAYAAVKGADGFVRQVWEELKKDYPNRATLLVVSDHGFSPINKMILPNVLLRSAGLVDVKGIRVVNGAVHVLVQSGTAMIYIRDAANRSQIAQRVKQAFEGVDGVQQVVMPGQTMAYGLPDPAVDPHAPDMFVFAKEGYSFGDTAAGALPFNEKPERKGTHGHDPAIPDLHATFVAWGVGIQPGAQLGEIHNTDVAPTIAKLLGIAMTDVDGKPLDGALAK
jgi:predicted AlkP superfamily pyrophosphatase or phosphodiesterase